MTQGVDVTDYARRPDAIVEDLEVLRVSLPMRKPLAMAGVTISRAENVFVRLRGRGLVGWGECTDARATTGETADDVVRSLLALRSRLPLPAPEQEVGAAVAKVLKDAPAARSALLTALLDLAARQLGVPAWRLLGGGALEPRPAVHIVSGSSVPDEVADARAAYDDGVRHFKLKAGRRPLDEELAGISAVTTALGAEAICGADANQGLSVDAALIYAAEGRGLGLSYLEQPVPRRALAELAARAARLRGRTPIAADESVGSAADVVRLSGSVDGVVLKLQKAGGPAGLSEAAATARRLGLAVGLTGKIAESSLASGALLHASAAHGLPEWGVSLTLTSLAVDPVVTPLERRDGWWQPPTGPGLGVEPDLAALAEHRSPLPGQ